MAKVLESEDRVVRGGRSSVDWANPVNVRGSDLVGSAIGRSKLDW